MDCLTPEEAAARQQQLQDYNEVLEGLQEMLAMLEDNPDDASIEELIVDARGQLATLAQALNAQENITVTPGLIKVLLPNSGNSGMPVIIYPTPSASVASPEEKPNGGGQAEGVEGSATSNDKINDSGNSGPLPCAPYEVHFDKRDWYACVITGVVTPAKPQDRLQYCAWILGYNVEEVVYAEDLRTWRGTSSQLTDALSSGVSCHGVDPRRGIFAEATVERWTLEGGILLRFKTGDGAATAGADQHEHGKGGVVAASSSLGASVVLEVPLSHVRPPGARFFEELRKRPQLTEEQRQQRRVEAVRMKRERAEAEKNAKATKVEQDANDWQALMGDMMGGGGGAPAAKKRRR